MLFEHLVVDGLLALQQLETHVGGTEVAADADEVGVVGAVAIDNVLLPGFADAGDADGQSGVAGGGVAADDVDVPFFAGQSDAAEEQFDVLDAEALADGQRDGHLARGAVHGKHVADVHHRCLVAKVLQVDVGEVKVYALHQQVGGDEYFTVGIREYGAVVAYAVLRRIVSGFQFFCEAVDESELANLCYFHLSVG